MMIFGISSMIAQLFVRLCFGYVDVFDWMLFEIWAVIAVCGAIKGAK